MDPMTKHNGNSSTTGEGNPHLIKVLMYHRIVQNAGLSRTHWTCVNVDNFRKQLQWLNSWGFTTITFEDYSLFLEGKLNLPKKPIIITFDDGYYDTYELAFPLLQEFGMKAVVFVLGERKIKTNYWDHPLGHDVAPLMERGQLLEMDAAGFEIGAHSTTHAKLTTIPEDRAWDEISQSKIMLEMALEKRVQTFCYPYGMVNEKVKRMVNHAGFSHACSVDSGPPTFGSDQFEIRRLVIPSSTGIPGFALRMLTPYEYFDWTRWKVGHTLHDLNGKRNGYDPIFKKKKYQNAPSVELK